MRAQRRKQYQETADIAAMIGRMIDALGRRVAFGDETDLRAFIDLAGRLDEAVADAVWALHDGQGFSWTTIAEATGTTRQAAQQRWGRRRGRRTR